MTKTKTTKGSKTIGRMRTTFSGPVTRSGFLGTYVTIDATFKAGAYEEKDFLWLNYEDNVSEWDYDKNGVKIWIRLK